MKTLIRSILLTLSLSAIIFSLPPSVNAEEKLQQIKPEESDGKGRPCPMHLFSKMRSQMDHCDPKNCEHAKNGQPCPYESKDHKHEKSGSDT